MASKLKLDLACGQRKKKGFKGCDIVAGPEVDYVFDLEQRPWPFEDNSVDEIYCCHYVEHCRDLIGFMNEVYRICKDEAMVEILHPYWNSLDAWCDPTHVRALNEKSWSYYNKEYLESIGMSHYPIYCDFEVTNVHFGLASEEFLEMEAKEREWHIQHTANVVREFGVKLRARK